MVNEGFTQAPPSTPVRHGPAPWSASAIAGFVCSLLGCLGITAVAGLILGVVGLFATSGGKRRGFGFAVAAIPLSLLSGIASGFLLLTILVGRQIVAAPERVESALVDYARDPEATAEAFRGFMSDEFNEAVSDQQLAQWLAEVNSEHGTLSEILVDPKTLGISKGATGRVVQGARAKFVNDTVPIEIIFAPHSGFGGLKISDISIDGSSPREDRVSESTP